MYKLSAQLSQLNNETSRKCTAEEYLSNLKQKVSEVEALIARKKERIGQIKEVVVHSHNEISTSKKQMAGIEDECNILGKEVIGPLYKPPYENNRKIRDKITLIQKRAKDIQPNETELGGEPQYIHLCFFSSLRHFCCKDAEPEKEKAM